MYKIVLQTENFITTLDRVRRILIWKLLLQSFSYPLCINIHTEIIHSATFTHTPHSYRITHTHTHLWVLGPCHHLHNVQWAGIETPIIGNLGNALPGDPSGSHDLLYLGCTEMTMGREGEKIVMWNVKGKPWGTITHSVQFAW